MDTNISHIYFDTAIKWCEDYLAKDNIEIFITIDGVKSRDRYLISSYMKFLKGGDYDSKVIAYNNLRKIKNILEKTKTLVALIN